MLVLSREIRAMLDEQSRLYGGIYAGKMTDQPAKYELESADMCLIVGRMDSDLK
jgi:TPP-dependent 2-oxoacid decarboxylase